MLQNVIDVETHTIIDVANPSNSAALLFFDLVAAFPWVARVSIWIALIA